MNMERNGRVPGMLDDFKFWIRRRKCVLLFLIIKLENIDFLVIQRYVVTTIKNGVILFWVIFIIKLPVGHRKQALR